MSSTDYAPRSMKTFIIIWLGQFASLIGSGLTSFALGVWIYEQTGQATPFALTVLFASLPPIILAPIGGMLADRWNRRLIMILADSGNAFVSLVAVLLLFSGNLQVWHIYLIALAGAIFSTFQEPAYTASITMLVPKEHLARASGLGNLSSAIERLLVPVLAGLLFVTIGLQGIMFLDFVTFFAAIGTLLAVRIPQPERIQRADDDGYSMWRELTFGWSYLRMRPGLFLLLWYFALVNFLLNFAAVLTTPLVLSFSNASALGVTQMMTGAGLLVGSLGISVWGGARSHVRSMVACIAISATGLTLIGLQPSILTISAGFFIMMFSIPFASASSQVLFQTRVEPAVQGRVFAMRSMISRSMMPLAFISAGFLADGLFNPLMSEGGALASTILGDIFGTGPGRGIGLMFSASGLLLFIVSAMAFTNRRLRELEEDLPEIIAGESAAERRREVNSVPGSTSPVPTSLASCADAVPAEAA